MPNHMTSVCNKEGSVQQLLWEEDSRLSCGPSSRVAAEQRVMRQVAAKVWQQQTE